MNRPDINTPIGDIPKGTEAIIVEPAMICEEHMEMVGEYDIPLINVILATQGAILSSGNFFEIAYQKRNGYAKPDDMDWDEIPDPEKPGAKHINMAMEHVEYICCFVAEHTDSPYPDDDIPDYIAIIANYAKEGM